ncbi:MAG: response regulator [Deltaproteobacteria bacterium]|nr:response regulator [Deltaproteobacteria bacterium]
MARVLVIDDEPDVVRLIVKVLSGRGHVVQIARDGASALSRVKHEPPDVILLDSDLPKIDGAEVCRRIKVDDNTSDIPIVMMTSSYIDIYDVATEQGPDAFIVRPFVREVLANVVERVLFRR